MTDEVDASDHPPVPDAPRRRRSVAIGVVVALVFVVLDQITKEIAEATLQPGRYVPWIGEHIGWQLVYNPGGAFGIRMPQWIFLLVTVVVVLVVGRALPRTGSRLTATAYGLLLSGALGNVVDRLVRDGPADGPAFGGGSVVDFVAWGTFPRFNVADSAITVGFVLLVIALWREERHAAVVFGADDGVEEADTDLSASPDPGGPDRGGAVVVRYPDQDGAGTDDPEPDVADPVDHDPADADPAERDPGPADRGRVDSDPADAEPADRGAIDSEPTADRRSDDLGDAAHPGEATAGEADPDDDPTVR